MSFTKGTFSESFSEKNFMRQWMAYLSQQKSFKYILCFLSYWEVMCGKCFFDLFYIKHSLHPDYLSNMLYFFPPHSFSSSHSGNIK